MNPVYGQSAMAPYDTEISSYPVDVRFPVQDSYNRFWAIPIVGYYAKAIILIPHIIILSVLTIVVGLMQFVTWIPVLFTGQYPSWGYTLVGGYIRWIKRVSAYFVGLSDRYPAFSLADEYEGDMQMMIQATPNNRLYAVPILGYIIKYIMLIPHWIILFVLGFVIALLQLVVWIPVLFTGQYPQWARGLNEGTIRWAARVLAFRYGVTDVYPPFQLER